MNKKKTKYESSIQRRGIFLLIASYLLAFCIMIVGIIIGKNINDSSYGFLKCILLICSVIPILLFIINILLRNHYVKKIEQMQVKDLQQYIVSHRECAEEMAAQKYVYIKKLRFLTDLYAATFSIFAFGIAFCAGILYDTDLSVAFCMYAAILFLCTLSRIRFSIPQTIFEENKSYISSEEYPELYALAKRAADTLQCNGNIKIAILTDCNAGIAKIGTVYSVQLGAIILNTFSKEELYCVLLHEFSHVTSENSLTNKENDYNTWLCNGGNPHFLSGLTSLLFSYPDVVYSLQYSLYLYASSIQMETTADQAMIRFGDAKMAASALLKLKYYSLYSWEKGTYDEECLYAPKQPHKSFLSDEIASFKKAIALRMNDWNRLVNVEILARSASHPTLKMRLDTLGITDLNINESTDSDAFKNECEKALHFIEELICQEQLETYEEHRKIFYLDPKEKVETWETSGKPLIAEEYADINYALRQLGRHMEANALCEKALSELSGPARCYASFMKGCFLLHQYDASGIDYIYDAIEHNKNYIDEGLDIIGEFCCLTGNQEELDIYREKGMDLAQKDKDIYSQTGVLAKNDLLTGEQLPEDMLSGILTFIQSVDEESIQHIYLVRKTISDDFFTSAFVIQFDNQTTADAKNEILHKIFCHLDTCSDWQFSLFDYADVKNVKIEKIENSLVYSKGSK